MKKLILLSAYLLVSSLIFAQNVPEKINYQAVARDLSGNPLINQALGVEFEIRQGSGSGSVVYAETHTGITTNQFGLFTAEIGGGTPSAGPFSAISWGANLHYLVVIVNGNLMGSSQLLSVPYALYAKESQNGPQGLPGRNSLSIVTAELPGANCSNGGNKIEVGTDDNGNSTLDPFEIDFTYYVCNADTTASGQGFWSIDANNNIYNNNSFNLGNVGIGTGATIPKPHKLTVASTDTIVASFNGVNAGGAAILITNSNQTGATGIVFANNADTSALVGLDPTSKFMTMINGIQNGDMLLKTDKNLLLNSKLIINDADTIVFTKGITGNVYTNNKGLFDTDSLRVGGFNALNSNFVLTNNGNGSATWKDPNTLITGSSSPWVLNTLTNTIHQSVLTNKVGVGTNNAANKLHVKDSVQGHVFKVENTNVQGTSSISFQNNLGQEKLFIGYANSSYSLFPGNSYINSDNDIVFGTQNGERMRINTVGNVGIGTINPTSLLTINTLSGSEIEFVGTFNADISAPNQFNIISGGVLTNSGNEIHLSTNNTNRLTVLNNGNIGIGTPTPTAKFHLEGSLRLNNLGGPAPVTGNVLTTDASGNAQWQPLPLTTNFWNQNGTNIYNNNTGNVGIGAVAPEEKLDVEGILRISAGSFSFNTGLLLATPSPGVALIRAGGRATSDFRIEQENNAPITFHTSNAERVRITGGGDVGIGTTLPNAQLHVVRGTLGNIQLFPVSNTTNPLVINTSGSGGKYFQFNHPSGVSMDFGSNGTSGWVGTGSNHNLSLVTNSLVAATITNNGKVGIGTASPSAKLDVLYNETTPPNTNNALKVVNANTTGTFKRGIESTVSVATNSGINIGVLTTAGGATGTGNNYALHAYTTGSTGTNFAGYFGSGITGDGRVYIQDELGIGTTTPAEKLHIDGNTTSNNYIYNAPKTRYLTIGETDFRLANSSTADIYSSFGSGGVGIISSTAANALVAPVYLPHGSIITNIEVFYIDNSASSMTIDFQRRGLTGGLSSISSYTTTINDTTVQSTSLSGTTINNNLYSYNIRIYSTSWTAATTPDMKIYTIKITYTITETD
ncbi:MAG: hypothetical protein CVT95_02010 [Bacteroidetes bacterium HGW-Bacteroidetes-12]|nr:MAG: hypothetical protein CVT95_02010 [Bacteroidetes bacterium HGW-Bacteroidetes-12]